MVLGFGGSHGVLTHTGVPSANSIEQAMTSSSPTHTGRP